MVVFYKIWKIYNEIQFRKIKMDSNNRTITPLPRQCYIKTQVIIIIDRLAVESNFY